MRGQFQVSGHRHQDQGSEPEVLSGSTVRKYCPGYLSTVVRLWNLDNNNSLPEEIAGHWDEML